MNDSIIFLTVRGTLRPDNLTTARAVHDSTAGSPQGIAAARSLGDLSHKVYRPIPNQGAKEGELLFLDVWTNAEGIVKFFSNEEVQHQAGKLFTAREPNLWRPAPGAFAFALQAPMGKNERYVGLIRGHVKSPEEATEVFRGVIGKGFADARRRGQMSHELFIKIPMPGDTSGVEILGVDIWYDAAGMGEHYSQLKGLAPAFVGDSISSAWQQNSEPWSEW